MKKSTLLKASLFPLLFAVSGAYAFGFRYPPVAGEGANGAAGGDLTGTYPNPNIAANAITASKVLDGGLGGGQLQGTITGDRTLQGAITLGDFDGGQAVSIASALLRPGDIAPSALSGGTNNYAPTNLAGASVIRQDLSAAANLTGLTGCTHGRLLTILNISTAYTLTLNHNSGSSSSGNKFTLPNAVDYDIGPGSPVTLWCDASGTATWRVLSASASAWTPGDIPDAEIHIHGCAATRHCWIEGDASTQALTHPTADTNLVGSIDDPVKGHWIQAASSGTRPELVTVGTASSIYLNSAGPDGLIINNSTDAFRFFHETGIGGILFFAQSLTDGSTQNILDQRNNTGANAGVNVQKTSGNKIRVRVDRGNAEGVVFDCTSSANFLVADGEVPVTFVADNANGATLTIGSNAPESCARTNAPTTRQPVGNMAIGRLQGSNAGNFNGYVRDLVFTRSVVSAANLSRFRVYKPRRSTTLSLVRARTDANGYFNFGHSHYRFDVAEGLYQDTARSTPVASDNDPVRLVDNYWDRGTDPGHLNREATAASDSVRPLWQDDATGATWDGSDDNLDFAAVWPRQGAQTLFVVAANSDNTNGSHLITSSSSRIGVSGPGYVSNPPPGDAYWTLHPTTGSGEGNLCQTGLNEWNIFEVVRDGSSFTLKATDEAETTFSNSTSLVFTDIGDDSAALSDWQLDGKIREVLYFTFALSPVERTRVREALKAKYSISGSCDS